MFTGLIGIMTVSLVSQFVNNKTLTAGELLIVIGIGF